jgi:hypothetical protein
MAPYDADTIMDSTRLRRAGRRALGVLMWPVVLPLIAAWAFRIWPQRLPDLRWLARRDDFRQLQAGAAAWADRHFERIEASAPWLDPVGRWVADYCQTSQDTRAFSFPPDPPSTWCKREVTAIYGTDGYLDGRLAQLRAALGAAGWTIADHMVLFGMRSGESLMWPFHWSASDGLSPSVSLETIPARGLDMGVGWATRGRRPELRTDRGTIRSGDPRIATAMYQPVEVGGTSMDRLASEALARHQHTIAIRIGIDYYYNSNVNAEPGRLRKRLFPKWTQER